MAIHREHPVGGDQDGFGATGPRLVQAGLERGHVAVGIAIAPRLAQADAVDQAGVVEAVGNNRVVLAQQRFEHPTIGVEGGGEQDRIFLAEIGGDCAFQLLVDALRAADEADRGQSCAPLLRRRIPGGNHARIAGEAKVIFRAEVDDGTRACGRRHCGARTLRGKHHTFGLFQPVGADLRQCCLDPGVELFAHRLAPWRTRLQYIGATVQYIGISHEAMRSPPATPALRRARR